MCHAKRCLNLSAIVATVFLFGGSPARAASGMWNGTQDVYWTNSANWSLSPFPSGSETASFANSGNGQTVINLAGLSSISNIVFDTVDVVAYTLGAGAANSQNLIMANEGEFLLGASAATGQLFNSAIQLGPDGAGASYNIRNNSATQTLSVNNVNGNATVGGTKTLNINGIGPVSVLGNIAQGASAVILRHNAPSTLTLSGNNTLNQLNMNGVNGVINLSAGTTTFYAGGGTCIVASENGVINGPGKIVLSTGGGDNYADNGVATGKTLIINAGITGVPGFEYWHGTYLGTFVLAGQNDFYSNVIMNVGGTISVSNVGNQGSTTSNLGRGQRFIFNGNGARLLYTGTGEDSNRLLDFRQNCIIEQAGSGNLKFTTAPVAGTLTCTVQGSTSGTGEFAGAIPGGVSLVKAGTGTWYLSGANTYSGSTIVNGGKLVIRGSSGAAASTSDYMITNGATLQIDNTSSANNGNRLRDAATVTLNGGTLNFSNDGSSADYSETAGTLSVNAGANTVAASQAPAGKKSTLRFASITRAPGATVDFSGTGIGDSDQNRIFITGQADGLLGSWATINGSGVVAYSSARGVYALSGVVTADIAARGPGSVITNNASVIARITSFGDSGPITLEGEWTNSILQLQQNVATGAVVRMCEGVANKTLMTSGLMISEGQSSLTIGESAGDGYVSPLTSGGSILLENKSVDAVLTVNAPIVNNTTASAIGKSGSGKVVLASSNTYSGATAIYEGTLAFGGSVTQTLFGVINGGGTLAHEGTGRLTLTAANTYSGPTLISGGMVLASNNAALGSSAAGTFVSNGGTLDIGGSANDQAMNLNAELITVSGAGVNGRGAIINGSPRSQYNALRLVTLSGDATFGGELSNARWDLRNVNGTSTFTMNGFNLTKVGLNQVGLTGVNVLPGAGNIDIKEGSLTAEVGTTMGGSSTNTLTVRNGAFFDFYQVYSPIVWSMVMDDGARLYARNGNVTNQNIWAGPVSLNGSGKMDGGGGTCFSLGGDISGASGNVIKIGSGSTTYFTGANNTYGGVTIVSNGTLYAYRTGSLPGYATGKLTVAGGGTLAVPASNGVLGWNTEQILALHNASTFTAVNAALGIDTSFASMSYPYDFTNRMGLTKLGNGTLTLSGINTYRGDTRVYGGNLVFNGSGNHEIGTLYVGNASLFLTNNAPMCVYVTNNNAMVGDASTDYGRMIVGGNTAWGGFLYTQNIGQTTLFIGNSGRGVLTLQDNASITQRLYVGNNNGSFGAVYQNGGTMHNWGGSASDPRIGMNGYGYYELNSGTFTNNGYTQLGCYYTGVGILKQTGGAFKMGSRYGGQLGISRGGTGVVYTAGGTFDTSAGVNVGEESDFGLIRGFAEFTVDGSADVNINGNIKMADRTNMFATVNLNGGKLAANQFSKSSSRTGSLALVNFDGGTFVSRAAGNIFNTGVNAPDAVNIYAGGATFDTTNLAGAIRSGLLAPAGQGVSGISITPRGGYMGPPHVVITGGGGTGATAIAQFNSASGFVNGIDVTCPGYGYTSVPTVIVSGGGITNQYVAVASLGANVSGGLTKLGSGSLTLMATNTYAGATTISNGTLALAVAAALPTGTDINVAGGVLDLGGFSITGGVVTASSGSIVNGSLVSDSFTKIGGGSLTLAAPIASGDPLVIESGTVKLQAAQPGLFEAPVNGSFNTTDPMTTGIVTRLTTRMANIVYTEPYNVTWIYKGFVWNRASTDQTWTFAENFDDNVKLVIDSTTVIANGNSWNVPTIGTYTLTPGAHPFEVRFGQGGGGGGPVNSEWWKTTAFGFGVDRLGRNETNIANYAAMIDPGDGSLFTTTSVGGGATNLLDASTSLQIASGAVLDLDGYVQALAGLSGSGTISNGTLLLTGTVSPGGVGSLGHLTLACDATLSGTLLVDLSASDSDSLIVKGNLTLSETSALVVSNPGLLDVKKTYTIASVSAGGQIAGAINWTNAPNSHWRVKQAADGSLRMIYVSGTILLLH